MPKRGSQARSRGFGRTTNRTLRFVTKTRLHQVIHGVENRCRADPSPINPRPWKQQVLVFIGTGTKTFKDSDITAGILTQNGIATLTTGFVVTYSVQSFRAWQEIPLNSTTNVPAPLKSPFTVKIRATVGESDIKVLTDVATNTRYAKLAYTWPSSQQITTLAANQQDEILTVAPTDTDQTWIVHLHVLWTTTDSTTTIESGKVYNIAEIAHLSIDDRLKLMSLASPPTS